MSDDDLRVVLRGLQHDIFTREPLTQVIMTLHQAGYRLRRLRGSTSPPIEYRVGETWHESDLSTFIKRTLDARSLYLQMFVAGLDVSLSGREHAGETYLQLHTDRVYFGNLEQDGTKARSELTPLQVTQTVLHLIVLLAGRVLPSRIYGGPAVQVQRIGEQLDWAASYAELPWLFALHPNRLPAHARDALKTGFARTTVPLADGRLLVAMSDNPCRGEPVAGGVLGGQLLVVLNRRE